MQFGLSLFATFIAPFILIITWLTCLWRLRSPLLLIVTLIIAGFILLSTSNALIIAVRNPYLMLLLSGMLIFNVMVLSRASDSDKNYLVAANMVLLLMLAAFHAWNLYLRQSELFFYEQSNTGTLIYTVVITVLTIIIPVIAFFTLSRHRG